jgi:hypothetical protein
VTIYQLFDSINEKVFSTPQLTDGDVRILSLALLQCRELAGSARETKKFKDVLGNCLILIAYGRNRQRYATLEDCKVVLESLQDDNCRKFNIEVLKLAIYICKESNTCQARELLRRIEHVN